MRRRLLNALALPIALTGVTLSSGQEGAAATGPMAKETLAILRDAVIAATPDPGKVRAENLAALDRLARTPWRRVAGLPWVHVVPKGAAPGQFTGAWKVADDDDRAVTLLATDLNEVTLERSRIGRIEGADLRADLGGVIRSFRERNPEDKRKWDFTIIQDLSSRGYPFYPGVFLLRLAYAAADCGWKEEADALVAEALSHAPKGLANLYDERVWQVFRPALFQLHDGGPRAEFLATCKDLLASYPGSRYDEQLRSLITPLEREANAPRPAFLDKPPEDRTQEETIRSWVHQLRDLAGGYGGNPGYPHIFSGRGDPPRETDRLVAIGPPALPYLIEALGDDTPTRTIAWQRSFYPIHFVLRRQDLAMKCLERIVGCRFYEEGATFVHLHMDTPERRASVLTNVREWWKRSRGASQARMIRNQLTLQHENITLSPHHRITALETLAMLEGPEAVVPELHRMLAEEPSGLNNPVRSALDRIDPQAPVREAFRRFRAGRSQDGDYTYLYKYGDRATYREIARRFEATGKLDPGAWAKGDQAHRAAWYGKNWALPIVAGLLKETEMTGSRIFGNGPSQPFSVADEAMEEFQRLTGKDFGYEKEGGVEGRLGAIARARRWWEREGRGSLKDRIAEDHPPLEDPGDLFLTDEEIDRRVKAIEGDDPAARRRTIATLGKVSSYKVQRALLNALGREADRATKRAILSSLNQHPELWYLPALTRVLERDPDTPTRVLAGQVMQPLMRGSWTRLETRDRALDAARKLVQDEGAPIEVRRVTAGILKAHGSFLDRPLLEAIAEDPAFRE